MKTLIFAQRTTKEVLRDPLTIVFGIGFPLILLLLMTTINNNIPTNMFPLTALVPGMAVFGLSFFSLFAAMLISKDRCTSFLTRLFTTPLSSSNYIFGYTLPLIPLALLQSVICYLVAFCLGLEITWNVIPAILCTIPSACLYIALGLLFGTILNDKAVGGICGTLLTNLTAWLSGIWFSLDFLGEVFKTIAYLLPFVHAVDLSKAALEGNYGDILPNLCWVLGYTVVCSAVAIIIFRKRMHTD